MSDAPKKYPCPDCRMCQMCSDTRCHLCLGATLKAQYDRAARCGGCGKGALPKPLDSKEDNESDEDKCEK